MNEQNERRLFEERAYLQYYLSCIQETNDPMAHAVQIHFWAKDVMPSAEFLAKDESGQYKEITLNSAWWAWMERAKEQERIDAKGE